jgi:hypothetical protein
VVWKNIEICFKTLMGFTEKCLLTMKTCRQSVFHPRETHIIDWLDITMLYTLFWVLPKISVHGKNMPKITILSPLWMAIQVSQPDGCGFEYIFSPAGLSKSDPSIFGCRCEFLITPTSNLSDVRNQSNIKYFGYRWQ